MKRKENVVIREKKLANGQISLYLDIYRSGKRSYEFLKLYIVEKPRTPQDRQRNSETFQLAGQIRAKRESELNHQEFGFIAPHKKKINYLDFYQNYIDTYTKKDIRMVENSFAHFKNFLISEKYILKQGIKPVQLTPELVKKFSDYLEKHFKGETPSSYLKRFKKVLKRAVDDGIIDKNPSDGITLTPSDGIKKAILSIEEIQLLAGTICGNPEIKSAFLFCLNTGLRFCDVKQLQFSKIDFSNRMLTIEQQKVKGKAKQVSINLNNTALNLIGSPRKPTELIFNLPTIESSLKTLKTWCKRAGIVGKNVTWHSSRHSFAVNLLNSPDSNIKTVSSLLGHSTLKHTEVYTRAIDQLKKNAVDSLPEINLQ